MRNSYQPIRVMLPGRRVLLGLTCSIHGISSPLVSRLKILNFDASRGSVRPSVHSILERTRR